MKQYIVTGMSCAACQARVEKAVSKVEGVTSCSVSLLTNSMGVEGSASDEAIIDAVEKAGYGAMVKGSGKKAAGDNASGASEVPGQRVSAETSGKGLYAEEEDALKDRETPVLKRRLILSIGFLMILMYVSMGVHMWNFPVPGFLVHNHLALALIQMILSFIVLCINRKFFINGLGSLRHGASNMDTLVALGSGVSFGWSLFVIFKMCGMITNGMTNMDLMEVYHNELYFESAAMIPALITVGKMLEAMSKGRTTNALKSLMKLAPKTAILLKDGVETEVPIEVVQTGDQFAVRPGAAIPADGIVITGTGAVNESALTGESIPVDKEAGSKVSAGTINLSGYLVCQASEVGKDTALSKIIQMVSDTAATKAPIARIADKVSGIFVPAVVCIALVVLFGWLFAGQSFSFSLERAISVLVISCPCALGLATPVAIMVGNGMGAKHGILFKTSEALENAGKISMIAIDKTGTITEGTPSVTDILPSEGISEAELLMKAAVLEERSEHPLSKAVTAEKERQEKAGRLKTGKLKADEHEVTDFTALPGNGLQAMIDGKMMYGGNLLFIRQKVSSIPKSFETKVEKLQEEGKTPLFFAEQEKLLGVIAVSDRIREDSHEAISELRKMGIEVIMLTGDNERTARAIGEQAGVDRVIAGVLPDGKEAVIRELKAKGKTAMVGDGINDAPALTSADVGIAIGAGTDVAIDSADIVVMNSRLSDVAAAIRLSKGTLKTIHQNLFWAFFYNAICIPLAAGLFSYKMNPMVGAACMSLSSFTVCMNALRLNLLKFTNDSVNGSSAVSDIEQKENGQELPENNEQTMPLKEETTMTQTIKVEGMMCMHCEANVKKGLEALPFVESCKPDHEKNIVEMVLCGDFDEAAVKQVIDDKGYTYVGME